MKKSVTYHELISHANNLGIQFVPWTKCKRGQKLGSGATMNVFSGTFEVNGVVREAAFKFVTTRLTGATREKKRSNILRDIRQEIRIMGRLKGHSRIVQLFAVSFDDYTPILILERAISNLEDYLQEQQNLEWKIKFRFIYDIALGLEAIHKADVVHGDLKAANILIYDDDNEQLVAKISDFGFSSTSFSIKQGRTPGYTIQFRSRECFDLELKEWNGKPTTDLYSYGLVTYQIATDGVAPFEEYDDDEIDNMKIEGTELQVIIDSLPADTPVEIQKVITATVRNIPSERSSVDEIKNILRESNEWDQVYSYEEAKTAFESFTESKPQQSIVISKMNELPIPPSLKNSIFCEYQRLADEGDMISLSRLGSCWSIGFGTEQDNFKAVECYQKAADAGNVDAQYNLAVCYYNGEGITKDFTKAVEYYTKAADAGDINATNNLGSCYEDGMGVPQDYFKAAELYTKASDAGHVTSLISLGVLYENGTGVPKDPIKAAEIYKKAVETGNAAAHIYLGICYQYGTGVEKDYSKAIELFAKAAEAGNPTALFNLGICYELGEDVIQDYVKAVELYSTKKFR